MPLNSFFARAASGFFFTARASSPPPPSTPGLSGVRSQSVAASPSGPQRPQAMSPTPQEGFCKSPTRSSPRLVNRSPHAMPPATAGSAAARDLPKIKDPRRELFVVNAAFDKRKLQVPSDLPRGPWPKFKDAKISLQTWALRMGFKFVFTTAERPPTSRAGAKRYMNCAYAKAAASKSTARATTAKGDHCNMKCKFHVNLEESRQGWAVLSANFNHSEHPFADPLGERAAAARATAGSGKMPESLKDLGIKLRRAGQSAADIDKVLTTEAAHQEIAKTWTNHDIYNAFCRGTAEQNLRGEHNRARERETGCAPRGICELASEEGARPHAKRARL